jgi:restriction system protein
MDISPIINQVETLLWLLIPIAFFAFVVVLKSPWFKGVSGEFIINVAARMFLNKDVYHLMKNVTLPFEGGTTQIDHIIISKYGVFVVETKNMKGWIFGNPNDKIWTQKIYKHSNKFQNPLHQNYKHIKALESILSLNEQQVHSVVVFVGDSTFKTKMPDNVTYGRGYIRFIKSKDQPVFSETEVGTIVSKINACRLKPSRKTNREHVKYVKHITRGNNEDRP